MQYVDPEVSRAKFDRELADYRRLERDYQRRGWFLAEASFPTVLVVLTAPHLSPPPVVTGVLFDYTNYDARPPSVRLVNPFTREPYRANQLPTALNRSIEHAVPGVPEEMQMVAVQSLMQFYSPEDIPFLCVAGVREYHDHPGHSGDPWELHRPSAAGSLVRLLNLVHTYGVAPLRGWAVNFNPQVTFGWAEPPR
ncbi:putative metal-binding protein [Micromonospora aurantiaca (nom. illeg.)]